MRFSTQLLALFSLAYCACSPRFPVREALDEPGQEIPPARPVRISDHLEEGHRLLGLEQYGPAMEQVRLLLAMNPNDAQARLLKGCILIELGDTAAAARILDGLVEQYPGNLAVFFAGEGHYQMARVTLAEVFAPRPDHDPGYDGHLGRHVARRAYERSMQLLGQLFSGASGVRLAGVVERDDAGEGASAPAVGPGRPRQPSPVEVEPRHQHGGQAKADADGELRGERPGAPGVAGHGLPSGTN
jgi:tetratricopeptide (TPR) repeat protein